MQPLLAAAPILVLLVLMLGPRLSAARAGAIGALTAAGIGIGVFSFPQVPGVGLGAGLTILWIIGPALDPPELVPGPCAHKELEVDDGRYRQAPHPEAFLHHGPLGLDPGKGVDEDVRIHDDQRQRLRAWATLSRRAAASSSRKLPSASTACSTARSRTSTSFR